MLAALAAGTGCGAETRDATSKELSALTAEISKLRAEQNALSERLSTIERAKPKADADPAAPVKTADAQQNTAAEPASRSLDQDRPALDVVRLGPSADDGDETDGDIDADGPRTVLRSGASGIIVEEQMSPGTAPRTISMDPSKKPATKKSDKGDRKKTAALPTP